jgi:hypothetical protein
MGTAASVTLGAFELAVFPALAISLIVHAGPHNTDAVFGPHYHNAKGLGSVIPCVLYAGCWPTSWSPTGPGSPAPGRYSTNQPSRPSYTTGQKPGANPTGHAERCAA